MQPVNRLFRVMSSTVVLAAAMGCATHGQDKQGASQHADDSWITSKVKTAFVKDKTLNASDINVETSNGAVQLSGFVNDPGDLSHAAELAGGIEGVTSVRNDLQVK
jgi:osmotically-inducible protein OsmY